ncbi:EF-hand domain-containing protein [Actinophytocola sp.]|uniref:EF-hand domain-containing protein n=1 Tax=Actinophytocola sp. TaxID=1872138 RepID=UPI002D4CE282|nr:EF-hand domain-containing protein [Actinophytocola sp.]HYQ67962.1 EF-hand domain-containing protein [Actinophytocola sp.]
MDSELTDTFAELDVNGDGQITGAEFHAAMAARGEPVTKEEIESIFADADTNHDGKISFTEFAAAWRRADPA